MQVNTDNNIQTSVQPNTQSPHDIAEQILKELQELETFMTTPQLSNVQKLTQEKSYIMGIEGLYSELPTSVQESPSGFLLGSEIGFLYNFAITGNDSAEEYEITKPYDGAEADIINILRNLGQPA